MEMGEGISETLYRRTLNAVIRGNYDFIISDKDTTRVLRELLKQEPIELPPRFTPARIRFPVRLSDDPYQLRERWGQLSESRKEKLFLRDPFLGNRDGIPQADRDRYNRRNLENLLKQARDSGDDKRSNYLARVKRIIENPREGGPPIYLSYLDNEGRIAFSMDNPDFSDNNVVLLKPAVPSFDDFEYSVPTAEMLRNLAQLTDPNARTSVTYWGGYDQPQSMVQAIFPHFAREGADRVRAYHEGLRATHEGPPAHTTTVGHSYGSVLLGHAAGHGATLNTDALLFMGSWGTGVNHVSELSISGVAPENMGKYAYDIFSAGDHVQTMPDTHGLRPGHPEFGATKLDPPSGLGGIINRFEHNSSFYLDSSSPASGNIGLIITGHGDMIS